MYPPSSFLSFSSPFPGIQGRVLEVTVVGYCNLKDTQLFTRQDPYVSIQYGNSEFCTRTCTDGGMSAMFQEKFQLPLFEGLMDMNISVWNSNPFRTDTLIGSGRVQLQKVLSQGYDDSSWTIQTRDQMFAGEVKLIMHFSNALLQGYETGYNPTMPFMYNSPPTPYNSPTVTFPGLCSNTTYPPQQTYLSQPILYPTYQQEPNMQYIFPALASHSLTTAIIHNIGK
ncbi:16 kDa phloem protein 1-like [Typha latifolia]|uniref:16 kDa phloem protein 1-like n=1 Tax=Typha latifolia TaxID=4733 RepID=UPI003C3092C6